jgi:hypothetical protein
MSTQTADEIDISKCNKAEVLAALYNAARPVGLGLIHYTPEDMTIETAELELKARADDPYFDYLNGRVMKVDLSKAVLNTRLYDRDNGRGAAHKAIVHLLTP